MSESLEKPRQSTDELGGFRFMLTEETREESLLRRRRSSMETDEQLLQYLNETRQSEDCDYIHLCKMKPSKITESEESVNVKEKGQSPQNLLKENIHKCPLTIHPSDLDVLEEEHAEPRRTSSRGESSREEMDLPSLCNTTALIRKFFVQQKSNDQEPKAKPPIYRNINIVFKFKSRLKNGTYTIVNRYFSRVRKIDVAIKIIPKIGLPDDRFFKFVPRELDLAEEKKFRHPNIVKFLETYEIGLRIYIMMEYVNKGNLSEFIKARGRLDPLTYRTFFRQLINAVNYCLDYGICHRKLSTDNCLVTSDFQLKLCDFSYCRQIKDRDEILNTFCGVLGFTAPEILMCRKYRPNMTEAWSCGIILFTMIYGAMPFDSSSFARLLQQVMKPIKYHWYCDTPFDAIMIMYQCISPIDRRWTIKKILGHRWVTPPSTKGYENYMKWYKKRTRGPSVPVVRKKFLELMELIKRDYVIPLNEKQEKMYQRTEEEASEYEIPIGKFTKERLKLCELMI